MQYAASHHFKNSGRAKHYISVQGLLSLDSGASDTTDEHVSGGQKSAPTELHKFETLIILVAKVSDAAPTAPHTDH